MASINVVNCGSIYQLRGLSTDRSKVNLDNIGVGTTYYEIDTAKCYIYNGGDATTGWTEIASGKFTVLA